MIPVCQPSTTKHEIKWVNKALKENKIGNSDFIELFEKEFNKHIGTKDCVAVSSGTTALHLALVAANVKKGDTVLIPDWTMIAVPNAVSYCGATPIFSENEITKRTKAIIVCHLFGWRIPMEYWKKLAKKYKLILIEDAAEYAGKKLEGDMICFSFFANKIITTGEGGAICTNKYGNELHKLRNHYFGKKRFIHKKIGYNYRMTSLQAAYGLGQLERWDELFKKRIQIRDYYAKRLDGIVNVVDGDVCWMVLITAPKRDKLMKYLNRKGIETRTGFYPINKQPMYLSGGHHEEAEWLWKNTMYLPTYYDLTRKQQDYIIGHIKKFYEN